MGSSPGLEVGVLAYPHTGGCHLHHTMPCYNRRQEGLESSTTKHISEWCCKRKRKQAEDY